jgi:hypothetical protein
MARNWTRQDRGAGTLASQVRDRYVAGYELLRQ